MLAMHHHSLDHGSATDQMACATKPRSVGGRRVGFVGRLSMAAVTLTMSTNAFAMNQEGHEDWMAGFPPAVTLLMEVADARPLPSPRCPVSRQMLADNPYEQVQLARHRCRSEQSTERAKSHKASTR